MAQTVQNLEVIVVDDQSTDLTRERVKAIDDDRILLYENRTNMGVSHSRNKGIELARGEWVAILDSDDWMAPFRLERLIAAAEQYGAILAADNLHLIHDGAEQPHTTYFDSRIKIIGPMEDHKLIHAAEVISKDLGYLKPIVKLSFLQQTGIRYDETLHIGEDFKFLTECAIAAHQLLLLKQPAYYYRIRANSLSGYGSLAKEITSANVQLGMIDGLIRQYGSDPAIREALFRHKNKKQQLLDLLCMRQAWENGQRGKAVTMFLSKPGCYKHTIKRVGKRILRVK